jgi:hypothetical protein
MTTEGLHDMDILSSGISHCILYQSKAKLNMLQTTNISNGGIYVYHFYIIGFIKSIMLRVP